MLHLYSFLFKHVVINWKWNHCDWSSESFSFFSYLPSMELDIVLSLSELYLDRHVPVLDAPPSPLSFYREYVSPNKPVLIRNGLQHWTANNKWTPQYLRFVPCRNALVSYVQDYIMTDTKMLSTTYRHNRDIFMCIKLTKIHMER